MAYEDEEKRISLINSGGLNNLALRRLWDEFFNHYRSSKYGQANNDLNCLWIELGGDEDEGSEAVQNYEKIDAMVAQNWSKMPKSVGFKKLDSKDLVVLSIQSKLIQNKALFLKRLQREQGKGTAWDDRDDEETE